MRCLLVHRCGVSAFSGSFILSNARLNCGQLYSAPLPSVRASYSTKPQVVDSELRSGNGLIKSLSKSILSSSQVSDNRTDPPSIKWELILARIDHILKVAIPKYMDRKTIDLPKYMAQDIVYEDQVFGYHVKGADHLRLHMARVKTYYWVKSPRNKVEHCGSIIRQEGDYFFEGSYITVFYQLHSLRNGGINFLNPFAWFSMKANAVKPYVLDGAMDFHVNSLGLIYNIVHRKMTAEENDVRQNFLDKRKTENQQSEAQKSRIV